MKSEIRPEFDEAVRLLDEGRYEAAKERLLKLKEIDPCSVVVLATLAHAYWEAGFLEEAVQVFAEATKLKPNFEAVSLGLFHCLWDLGKNDEAFAEMKRFMSLSDSANYREIINAINSADNKDKTND